MIVLTKKWAVNSDIRLNLVEARLNRPDNFYRRLPVRVLDRELAFANAITDEMAAAGDEANFIMYTGALTIKHAIETELMGRGLIQVWPARAKDWIVDCFRKVLMLGR